MLVRIAQLACGKEEVGKQDDECDRDTRRGDGNLRPHHGAEHLRVSQGAEPVVINNQFDNRGPRIREEGEERDQRPDNGVSRHGGYASVPRLEMHVIET